LATRGLNAARGTGANAIIPHAVEILTVADCWNGHYPLNEPNVFEGLRLARQSGQANSECHLLALLAMAAAVNGDGDACQHYARPAEKIARRHGVGLVVAQVNWALAMLDVVHARWAPAYQRLGPAVPGRARRRPSGRRARGHGVLRGGRRRRRAARSGAPGTRRVRDMDPSANRPGLRGIAARCRALLAEGADAEAHYREALKYHQSADRDFERGYTELLYARHLRRGRQRSEARDRLHSALEVFERLELDLWTKRVRAELRAVGERGPAEEPPAEHDRLHASGLTAQQVQIATLVAEGATNREIAARMFVSTRTVDYHLRRIFQSLGITSRAELIRRFG
jgi:DNA-binding CsgD family transcriptional regulator